MCLWQITKVMIYSKHKPLLSAFYFFIFLLHLFCLYVCGRVCRTADVEEGGESCVCWLRFLVCVYVPGRQTAGLCCVCVSSAVILTSEDCDSRLCTVLSHKRWDLSPDASSLLAKKRFTFLSVSSLIALAADAGSESRQHQLQLSDDGVGPLHLHQRESGWAEPGGHRRPERPHQPHPPANHSGQRHHEPGQQSHRAERCRYTNTLTSLTAHFYKSKVNRLSAHSRTHATDLQYRDEE